MFATPLPLFLLASIEKLDILQDLFHEITIPEAVYSEIKTKEGHGYHEVDSEFVKVKSIKGEVDRFNQLDLGEAETILLAEEIEADFVIIDENLGYRIAKNSGLNVIRTLSILLKAKDRGIIKEIKPLLDEIISKGGWYSKKVYHDFLSRIGEL